MTQVKKFYPLENTEWLAMAGALKPTELVVLYHLRTLDPFGDRLMRLSVGDLAKTLNINRSTCSRALKKLCNDGYITMQLETVVVTVVRDQKVTPIGKARQEVTNQPMGEQVAKVVPIVEEVQVYQERDQKSTGELIDVQAVLGQFMSSRKSEECAQKSTEATPEPATIVQTNEETTSQPCGKLAPEVKERLTSVTKKAHVCSKKHTDDQKSTRIDQKSTQAPVKSLQGDDRDRSKTIKTIKTDQIEEADRDLREFMQRTIEKEKRIELKNPKAYIDKCLQNDRAHWEALYQDSKSPQRRTRDTIAEDIYLLELSVKGAMDGKDYEFARGRLNQCKAKAEILLNQYPEWRKVLYMT